MGLPMIPRPMKPMRSFMSSVVGYFRTLIVMRISSCRVHASLYCPAP